MAERARLVLNAREIPASCSAAEPEDVLHDENTWLKEINVTQELAIEMPPGILLEARAVIRTIHLAGSAKALARRPANDNVDVVCSNQSGELVWLKLLEIAFECMRDNRQAGVITINEICP